MFFGTITRRICPNWHLTTRLRGSSKRCLYTSYDGTPESIAKVEYNKDAFDSNIQTVELSFDKHSPKITGKKDLDIPPIVFLHGLFGSKNNNRSISKQLSKKLETDVYCLDLRNHGDSPHIERHDYPSMAADVEHFIKSKGISKPILIGHSMGAKCAMSVTLRNKDLCSALISIDNAPIDFTIGSTGFSKFGKYVQQLEKIESMNLKSLKECDEILSKVEPSLPIRQFLLTNMRRFHDPNNEEIVYKSRVPLSIIGNSLDNISGWPFRSDGPKGVRWNGPSLFVRGLKSAYVSDEILSSIGTFFPGFTTLDIDAGHWVTAEKPKEFLDGVERWIFSRF